MNNSRRRKSLRWVAAALSAAVLLTGCKQVLQYRAALPVTPIQTPRSLTFQVSSSLGREILDQADRFADYLEKISDGQISVEVTVGMPDQNTVATGETDFCILTSAQIAQLNDVFSMLQMPFLYDSYRHMGMVLNSERMLEKLSDRLEESGVVPLAAVAEQGNVLVCSQKAVRVPADFRELVIAVQADNTQKQRLLEALGARVQSYALQNVTGKLGAELDLLLADEQEEPVQINTVEASFEQVLALPQQEDTRFYMMNSYHDVVPLWVVVNRASYESLNQKETAWLQEGCAALLAGIDLSREAKEMRALSAIRAQGIRIVDLERRDVALWLYGGKGEGSDLYPIPENFDPMLYRLIQAYAE